MAESVGDRLQNAGCLFDNFRTDSVAWQQDNVRFQGILYRESGKRVMGLAANLTEPAYLVPGTFNGWGRRCYAAGRCRPLAPLPNPLPHEAGGEGTRSARLCFVPPPPRSARARGQESARLCFCPPSPKPFARIRFS